MSKLTPMMRQYLEIKADHQDSILFFRLGDFYEMFMDDAVVASRVLDIALTSRNKGSDDEVPLCGIPYHSCQPYINKLVDAGHKVAVCEQVESPAEAKGIVKREVVRVITPGLVIDTETLQPKENNYLAAVCERDGAYGFSFVDITTGEFQTTELTTLETLRSEIASLNPPELLIPDDEIHDDLLKDLSGVTESRMVSRIPYWVWEIDRAEAELVVFFKVGSLEAFGCKDMQPSISAAGAVLHYLQQTQREQLSHLRPLVTYHNRDYMVLDEFTRRNLEINANLQDGRKRGSLLGVLDQTVTAMGGRKLKKWLNYPLIKPELIRERQDAVAELVKRTDLHQNMRDALDGIYDLERLSAKISMANANAKDLVALRTSLERIPAIRSLLENSAADLFGKLHEGIDPADDVAALIREAIVDDPPFVLREGGLIRDGFNDELDEYRLISREGKGWIARLEAQERERTGINNLKVRYNKVFGYYLEVSKSHLSKVPEDYERKQTLANAERYITPQLKEYEVKVLGAEERLTSIEYDLFQQVRQQVALQAERIQRSADLLATIDVLNAFAELAVRGSYVRPEIDESKRLKIDAGRHPVIEALNKGEAFIPNDIDIDPAKNQILIITGPNMAGKSTFMRQVALIALMAQIGSFVPAESARVGITDRIFTRVGASDNLSRGLSTFMVEMNEAAYILNHATDRSLIVLDEIGRGTSTFDGVSIAWAVAEYLHEEKRVAARTLFATHYHELADLAVTCERIANYNVAVKEWNDQIIFLRRIVEGAASHSYGIQVARLAGLPSPVIDRAREVLKNLEGGEFSTSGEPRLAQGALKPKRKKQPSPQLGLFDDRSGEVVDRLRDIDVASLTPLEALNILDELKRLT